MRKKVSAILAALLTATLAVSLTACGGGSSTEEAPAAADSGSTEEAAAPAEEQAAEEGAAEGSAKIAVVFTSSGLGDRNINDGVYAGLQEAEKELPFEWVYTEPTDDAEYEGLLSGYADTGEYDLILCLGGSQSSSLENVAPNYPDQNFCILDAVVDGDNIRSYVWRDEELGFLSGVLGAALSETNTLGFIGAHDIELCNLGAAGMVAGAHYVNPECEVLVDYANGWEEVNGCYEISTSMNEQGASLIYHTASAGGLGILNAGKDKGFLTIFFDGHMNQDAPDSNIACALRDCPGSAVEAIKDVIDGNFTSGAIETGLAEGNVYMEFEGSNYEIPEDAMAIYEKAIEEIKSGKIVVPKTIDEAKAWTPAE